MLLFFFFQAEDGIRDLTVTGVQTCALPIYDLTFELKVPPGRSLVRLLGRTAGDWTTKAQRLNGVDVIDSGIDVRPGEDITGLEIELSNQQSQVTGTVSNSRGQPLKDYSVVVFSRDHEKWSYAQTRYIRARQP